MIKSLIILATLINVSLIYADFVNIDYSQDDMNINRSLQVQQNLFSPAITNHLAGSKGIDQNNSSDTNLDGPSDMPNIDTPSIVKDNF